MKFLGAIALLTLAVASAHHTPEHNLRGPRFKSGKLYEYDVFYNVSSGVLGLSSQVSRASLKAKVNIYCKDGKNHILKIDNVYTSGAVKSASDKTGDIPMRANTELQDRLALPIKFTLEDGKVTSYSLSSRENLESRKIKKSVLRSLEMHVPQSALRKMESGSQGIPVSYNETMSTDSGIHTAHYMITVSPYAEFPINQDVYNISRSDNFEAERYPAYKVHHNFQQQGCPEVCRKDWKSNEYCAGCPVGYEPHHSPIKTAFNHEHHLELKDNIMNPEIIRTTETHIAQMYDQDMEVLIMYQMRRTRVSTGTIAEPSGQQTYTDLQDMKAEINEKEINDLCRYKTSEESISSIHNLLQVIADVIVHGNLEKSNSRLIGQKIILLKNALTRLTIQDLEKVKMNIMEPSNIPNGNADDKVIRQIWLDVLPIIGTEESVSFIVKYIKEGLQHASLLIWEAKEILEALPQNVQWPTERSVKELFTLITDHDIRTQMKNHLLHSASHLSLARMIGKMCGNTTVIRSPPAPRSSWFSYKQVQENLEAANSLPYGPPQCSLESVKEIVKYVREELEKSSKKEQIAIYLETLSHIGVPEVLPTISKYVYGTAKNLQKYSPSYIEFVKSLSLFSMHNLAPKYPEEVLQIVLPVYFNGTESPKIRNAAFGVLIRCQPSMEILQHVAIRSWSETSLEVGSYVTSTLETFGNASLPCMQLTSHRIKKVLSHVKRFSIGVQHAKSLLWSYFDDNREFGLEGRLEYTPSNASFIPSTLYKSLAYSTDSLRDVLMQMALNVQGVTYKEFWKKMVTYLDLKPMIPITTIKEREIFGDAKVIDRIPEDYRLTMFKKIFYCSSYYYLDEHSMKSIKENLAEYLRTYLKTSSIEYDGYLVKVYLPSTYQTVAIAKTLPYPVEFEMKQPLVLALKLNSLKRSPNFRNFHMHIRPSVYFTRLFTIQIKNIGDCKEVGVYHEHKVALSYPFELEFHGINWPNVTLKYKKPELNKQVLTYLSEAGTYAGKKTLTSLPSTTDREPIYTQPAPFKWQKDLKIVGIPPLHVQTHTEDIAWKIEKLPRNVQEAVDIVLRRFANAGWRHKSMNITLYEDSMYWPKDTEVTFTLQYNREHITRSASRQASPSGDYEESPEWASEWESESQWPEQQPKSREFNLPTSHVDDWAEKLQPNDILTNVDPLVFIEQGTSAAKLFSEIPHIGHWWKVEVNTSHASASVHVKYNHTYSKTFHGMHMGAYLQPSTHSKEYRVSFDHVMGFSGKPDEFNYNEDPEKQTAVFISALGMPTRQDNCEWGQAETAFKGKFSYESLENLLKRELSSEVKSKYYKPESHESCLEDLKRGKAASTECIKAMKEYAIFNKLTMSMLWKERVPAILKTIAKRLDIYTKHYLFHHMNITEQKNVADRVLVYLNHIDKFVDEPVFDVKITKQSETAEFKRVSAKVFQPLSSLYSPMDAASMEATNNTYPATCTIMRDYVRTYDMKTYRFSIEPCSYVLATHCAQNKLFTITAQGLSNQWPKGSKNVTLYVADEAVVLSPPTGGVYSLRYMPRPSRASDWTVDSPIVLNTKQEIYAYTEKTTSGELLRVVAKRAGINILYDGVNVKVRVSPMYKGELCGLCSEFDGEMLREYRGMDQCLYTHPLDFAFSTITKREGECRKDRTYGQKACGGEANTYMFSKDSDNDNEGYEPTLKRNVVEARGNEYCFSILPVAICEDNARPLNSESQSVSFHCLPKRDVTAKKLITESKRRVLGELEGKPVDFEETLDVATMC